VAAKLGDPLGYSHIQRRSPIEVGLDAAAHRNQATLRLFSGFAALLIGFADRLLDEAALE
jgi:hypothetical protein